MMAVPPPVESRPRVEGDRELEILAAALEVLEELGYDRLTMNAVATRAKASKATLYRRWNTKASLVIEALLATKGEPVVPDTGSFRDDLVESACCPGGLADRKPVGQLASLITAINRDADFAEAFRREFIGPKMAVTRQIFERAQARGEIRPDIDLDLMIPALPGIVLHRAYVLGEEVTTEDVTRVIDEVIVPACQAPARATER